MTTSQDLLARITVPPEGLTDEMIASQQAREARDEQIKAAQVVERIQQIKRRAERDAKDALKESRIVAFRKALTALTHEHGVMLIGNCYSGISAECRTMNTGDTYDDDFDFVDSAGKELY